MECGVSALPNAAPGASDWFSMTALINDDLLYVVTIQADVIDTVNDTVYNKVRLSAM